MNETIELMKNHRSVRRYEEKVIEEDLLTSILEAGQCASTSSNLQAYSVLVIKDGDKKEQLAKLCGNQRYVASCPVFLVFCGDLSRIQQAGEINERYAQLDYTEAFLMASVDAALIAQNVMLAAESAGLGGVFIGGIRNNSQEVSDLLKLPDLVYPVFGMCLGYPDSDKLPGKKPRFPLESVIHHEEYNAQKTVPDIQRYDAIMEQYYRNRPVASRDENWSEYASKVYETPKRTHLRPFLEKRKFGFK